MIQSVVETRRSLLHAHGRLHAHDLADGRLLVYEPDMNLCDGAAELSSNGFFDVDNVPPWDTWVGCIYGTREQPATQGQREGETNRPWRAPTSHLYLLSWVPPPFLTLVAEGIWANPEECIRWAVDVEHDFIRQLQSVGLSA